MDSSFSNSETILWYSVATFSQVSFKSFKSEFSAFGTTSGTAASEGGVVIESRTVEATDENFTCRVCLRADNWTMGVIQSLGEV